jgi:hypothetical protein
MIVFSVFALLCNCFILAIFFKYPEVRKSSCFYRFACLAFDFGRILIASDTLRYQSLNFFEFQRLTCMLVSAIYVFTIFIRTIFVVSIAYDRYLAIKTPIAYLNFNHKKRALEWLAVIIGVALLTMFPYFYGYSSYTDVPSYCTPDASANLTGIQNFTSRTRVLILKFTDFQCVVRHLRVLCDTVSFSSKISTQ